MSDISTDIENPLLQIDTDFRSYLNAYTRSFQSHMVDGSLDYAFESDFAIKQKMLGLGGWSKFYKAVSSQDIADEAKHLFMKCDQVGSLKYAEIYDIVKKCSERLELNIPIAFVRNDMSRAMIYSVKNELIEPCIVISKQLAEMCTKDELTLLIGCECGRIQNNHCAYNMAFTYLNYNKLVYKPVARSYTQTVNKQVFTTLVKWVTCADMTAFRAGIICLDKPGMFIEIMTGLLNKGYIDFYGRQQKEIDGRELAVKAAAIHETASRSLHIDSSMTEYEKIILAANEFLYCETLYEWRKDLDGSEQHSESGQISDVRSSIILGNGGAD